jgi:DNA-binding transcriptional MerR regulator
MKTKAGRRTSLTKISAPSHGRSSTKRLYSVPELLKLTKLTRKQVTYWALKKLLVPTIRDHGAPAGAPSSFYSAADAVKALVFCDLRKAGFSLRQIQQVAKNLEDRQIRLDTNENYLLTDGYSVYYANSDSEALDMLKHYRQMLLLIPIHEQVEKLKQVA